MLRNPSMHTTAARKRTLKEASGDADNGHRTRAQKGAQRYLSDSARKTKASPFFSCAVGSGYAFAITRQAEALWAMSVLYAVGSVAERCRSTPLLLRVAIDARACGREGGRKTAKGTRSRGRETSPSLCSRALGASAPSLPLDVPSFFLLIN